MKVKVGIKESSIIPIRNIIIAATTMFSWSRCFYSKLWDVFLSFDDWATLPIKRKSQRTTLLTDIAEKICLFYRKLGSITL